MSSSPHYHEGPTIQVAALPGQSHLTAQRFLQIANRHTEMHPLLQEFVAELERLGWEAVGIRILDERGNIPYEAYAGFSQRFYESASPLSIHTDQCMCINVIRGDTDPSQPFYTPGGSFYMNGTTRFLETVSEESKGQTRNICNQQGYESVALIPIRFDRQILGLIHLGDSRENKVPLEVVETIETIAIQLGTALRRVWAEEELRQQRNDLEQVALKRTMQLEALRQVGLELTAELDLETLLHSIAQQAIRLVKGAEGGLYLYRPESNVLEWSVVVGAHMAQPGTLLYYGEGLCGKVWQSGQPLIVDDYPRWEGRAAAYENMPFAASIGVPVRWGDEFLGVLNVNAAFPHRFTAEDAQLLELLAAQAAVAIKNARLFEQERQQRELAETLARAVTVVSGTLNLDQVLATVLQEMRRLLDVTITSVWLLDPQSGELVCRQATGLQSNVLLGWRLPPGEGLAGWVTRENESLLVTDALTDERHYHGVDQAAGLSLHSIVSAPLQAKTGVIGAIQAADTAIGRFGAADLKLVESLATTAAAAIENARLYTQAQEEAATKSMLLEEINHRVKNNLSAIIGLLYAERRHSGIEQPEVYQSVMQDLIQRVQGLTAVHNMLTVSTWTPLPLSDLVSKIVYNSLQALPPTRRVVVHVSFSTVTVTPEQAHHLALVVNELATNVVKHGLHGQATPRIVVDVRQEGETVELCFRDNGPGYPEDVLQFGRRNVGLDLLRNIVLTNLRGELFLTNNGGAMATIRFPARV